MDTIYNESAIYVPVDKTNVSDLKTGNPLRFDNLDNTSLIVGPVNNAIQLSGKAYLKLAKPCCFDRPSVCLEGMSVAFWIKLSGAKTGPSFFSKSLPSARGITVKYLTIYEGVAFRAHIKDDVHAGMEVFVSSQTHFCSYGFPVATNAWSHVTIVWLHRDAIKIFLNGHRLPADANCTRVLTKKKYVIGDEIRLGSGNMNLLISLDEFVVWRKALPDDEAKNIFYHTNTGNPSYKYTQICPTCFREAVSTLQSTVYFWTSVN